MIRFRLFCLVLSGICVSLASTGLSAESVSSDMARLAKRLAETEATYQSLQEPVLDESMEPKRQAVGLVIAERIALLREEGEVLDERERVSRDSLRLDERIHAARTVMSHIREDILANAQAVSEEMVRVAKLEADIADANRELSAVDTPSLDTQLRQNAGELELLSQLRSPAASGADGNTVASPVDTQVAKWTRLLDTEKERLAEERLALLALQQRLGEAKTTLLKRRQTLSQLEAQIKSLRWHALKEKLARSQESKLRATYAKAEVREAQNRAQLEKAIDELEAKKLTWDAQMRDLRASASQDTPVFFERLSLLEKHQAAIDQDVALIREEIIGSKLALSLDFLEVEIARVRAQMASPALRLDELYAVEAYVLELWQNAWSEETMIRSRNELFKLRRLELEREITSYAQRDEASAAARDATVQMRALLEENQARIDSFQRLFESELKIIDEKKKRLRGLRRDIVLALENRPDAQWSYRMPLGEQLHQWPFWGAILFLGLGTAFLWRRPILAHRVSRVFKKRGRYGEALYQWMDRSLLWLVGIGAVYCLIFVFGWANISARISEPLLIGMALVTSAGLLRRFILAVAQYWENRHAAFTQTSGKTSFQFIVFIRTLADVFIWGGVAVAIILIFDLSWDNPVVEKILSVLEYRLVTLGKLDLNLLGIGKGVGIFLLFLYFSRLLSVFLSEYFFPRTTLDTGVRNAIITLSRYTFMVIGLTVGLSAMGIDLTTLTVFAGALGVGLGFGLQNIASNFISGLILLFERPVKEGDIVQIGKDFGQIQEIGARSTLLKTRDNIFLVVPNSNLITQEVINWTYRDAKTRLRLPISVSYASDIDHVERVCLEVATSSPHVLSFPAPEFVFLKFGESSLDCELLVWVANPLVFVNNEIYRKILIAFRKEGIEIPFPQRDVRVIKPESDL